MLQSVELVNFLSHSNTKLSFDRGVTVFVGQNGAGKSSIIDAITFALFGEHIRKSTKGLLRRGSNQAYVKVNFTIGNRNLEAVRKIDAKGTSSAQLYEKKNDKLVPLAAGERKQFGESMTKEIENLVGLDFEKLKVASIVQQGELQSIIEADPKKFKELVNAIIGIDKLDTAHDFMKKSIDAFRESIKSNLGYDDTDISMLKTRNEFLGKEITILDPQKRKLEEEKASQEKEFFLIQKKIDEDTPKELKIKEIEIRKEELVKYVRNKIVDFKRDLVEKEKKLAESTNSLSLISIKPQIESDRKQIENDLERYRMESKETNEKIGKIKSHQELAGKIHLIDGKCPVCNSRVDSLNPLFDEKQLKKELEALKKKADEVASHESRILKNKEELELKTRQIEKAEAVLSLYCIKTKDDLTALENEIWKLRSSVREIPEIAIGGNLMQMAIDQHSTDVINSISALINETKDFDANNFRNLKIKLEQQRKLLSSIDQEIGAICTKMKLYKEEFEKNQQTLSELHNVKEYVSHLETIRSQIYNRDGPVATSLRSWALNIISQKASEYLSTFNVKIHRITLEDKARDIGITCYSGNTNLDLESLSGGEKVSVALALRLGMAHLMGSSNLNFIILDEPTTHLDHERRKSLVNVLSQAFESNIDAISQFIIITHDSEIFENSNIDAIYDFKAMPEGTLVTPI